MLLGLFGLIGGLLGSLYSLGLAYLADLLPSSHMPEANAIAGAHFSVGCMMGPYAGGLLIHYIGGGSLFLRPRIGLFDLRAPGAPLSCADGGRSPVRKGGIAEKGF